MSAEFELNLQKKSTTMGEIEDGRTAAGEARSRKQQEIQSLKEREWREEKEGRQRKSEIRSILVPEGRT